MSKRNKINSRLGEPMRSVFRDAEVERRRRRWQDYFNVLIVLNVLTIVAPNVLWIPIAIYSSLPDHWPAGYILVAMGPILLPVLAFGQFIALLNIVTISIKLSMPGARRKVLGWLVVVLSAAYLAFGLTALMWRV